MNQIYALAVLDRTFNQLMQRQSVWADKDLQDAVAIVCGRKEAVADTLIQLWPNAPEVVWQWVALKVKSESDRTMRSNLLL